MSIFRMFLLALIAVPAMVFGGAASAHAGSIEDVQDVNVTGHSWQLLNHRTSERIQSVHVDLKYGDVLTGSDGCNDFWGTGEVNRETGTVTITIEGMTRRACLVAPEIDVTKELAGTHKYYLYGGRLTLVKANGARNSFSHA